MNIGDRKLESKDLLQFFYWKPWKTASNRVVWKDSIKRKSKEFFGFCIIFLFSFDVCNQFTPSLDLVMCAAIRILFNVHFNEKNITARFIQEPCSSLKAQYVWKIALRITHYLNNDLQYRRTFCSRPDGSWISREILARVQFLAFEFHTDVSIC